MFVIPIGSASIIETVGSAGSARSLDADTLDLIKASHPSEWLTRIPGVWITRNSGQEHLTAIRSGVLTGAGACGEFLILENAIPVRPAGFCNVNGLIEVNWNGIAFAGRLNWSLSVSSLSRSLATCRNTMPRARRHGSTENFWQPCSWKS